MVPLNPLHRERERERERVRVEREGRVGGASVGVREFHRFFIFF
jgi:hypothetical protein